MPDVQFWTWLNGLGAGLRAPRAEQQGWDGIALGDSQNVIPDPFVELGIAASATTKVLLGTAVANPLTRIPATLAAAAATVQAESNGRAVLGIGRGDSALAHLGLGPVRVSAFEAYLRRLQSYLRGEEVAFDRDFDSHGIAPEASSLGIIDAPDTSRLRWLTSSVPKVVVDVAASGPKTIELGALLAESITFALGLSPARLRWGMEHARTARRDHGLAAQMPFGTYVPVLVHPNRRIARDLVSGMATSVARFSVMHGVVSVPIAEKEDRALRQIHRSYDVSKHFTYGSPQSRFLDDEMIDSFGIAGPPSYCIERISELIELGLTKIFVMDTVQGLDPEVVKASRHSFTEEVLPALR
jgi:5,10-methylenetetrahydromethanopterin reductase